MGQSIFVGGLMKSGTSLVRVLICQNSSIFGGPETHWFDTTFSYDPSSGSQKRLALFQKFFELNDAVLKTVLGEEPMHGLPLLEVLMNYLAKRDGSENWAEKTPANIEHVDEILSFSPNTKFVFVDRDPCDTYASWKTNSKGSLPEFLEQRQKFKCFLRAYRDHSRVAKVAYEDVVSSPQPTVDNLMQSLGMPPHSVESFSGDQKLKETVETVLGRESATAKNTAKPIFQSSVGNWRTTLNQHEVESIQESENAFCS